MKIRVVKENGDIHIPKDIRKQLGLQKDDYLELSVKDETIVMRKFFEEELKDEKESTED